MGVKCCVQHTHVIARHAPKVLPTKDNICNKSHEIANGRVLDASYLRTTELVLVLDRDEVLRARCLSDGHSLGVEKPSVLEPKAVAPLLECHRSWHASQCEGAPWRYPGVLEDVFEASKELVGDVPVRQVVKVAENSQPGVVGHLDEVIEKPLLTQECIGLPPSGHHLPAAHPIIVLVHSSTETLSLAP